MFAAFIAVNIIKYFWPQYVFIIFIWPFIFYILYAGYWLREALLICTEEKINAFYAGYESNKRLIKNIKYFYLPFIKKK